MMKYHLASSMTNGDWQKVYRIGARNLLFSAYEPVLSLVKGDKENTIIKEYLRIIGFECPACRSVIQDSGLFTMLFGKAAGKTSKEDIYSWYDALIDFTKTHNEKMIVVEVDAQKFIGSDEAHKLRERMRKDLPHHRIINVFHIEDKMRGLDRLIEFSDYIGLPSKFFAFYPDKVRQTIEYIKNKKPTIDIHLLGFSNSPLVDFTKKVCSSCDSTSWINARRFGRVGKYAVGEINKEKIKQLNPAFSSLKIHKDESINAGIVLHLHYLKSIGLRWD